MRDGATAAARPPRILMHGPSRRAVSGVSTHLNQLFGSSLGKRYELIHFQIGSQGRNEGPLGALLRFVVSPFALAAAILRHRPAIVHFNTGLVPKAFWRDCVYLAIARLLGCRIVYQVHGGELPQDFFPPGSARSRLLHRVLASADAVVLLASIELEAYGRFGDFRRLTVIPNAVDVEEFAAAGEPAPVDERTLQLVYLGRLTHDKGVLETIEAMKLLVDEGRRDLRFLVAGLGPYEQQLRDRVRELDLSEYVTFLGAVFGEDKIALWRRADLLVFPTYFVEGLPYTVLEALASGTPAITTRMGAIPDVVVDGVQGLLVPTRDPRAVAEAVRRLADDPELRQRMARAAVERARQHYGVERLARDFDALFRAVLDAPVRAPVDAGETTPGKRGRRH